VRLTDRKPSRREIAARTAPRFLEIKRERKKRGFSKERDAPAEVWPYLPCPPQSISEKRKWISVQRWD
jgi:hypothetical protein